MSVTKSFELLKRALFKKHKNPLEGAVLDEAANGDAVGEGAVQVRIPDSICLSCPTCKKTHFRENLDKSLYVCSDCGTHFKASARQRIKFLADANTFEERDGELESENPLNFPDYDKKLAASKAKSGEREGVICGTCRIGGILSALFAMEGEFMMGSMGAVVGEKLARLFEYATKENLPVVGFTVSGGARMQEGILSLMQMAKVSGAVKRHSDAGNFYAVVLTNPTSGGVTASFAMLADVILAEPDALICFAGPRVIEQTIRQRLPEGFQHAEFVLKTGFLDGIIPRKEQKQFLTTLLKLHRRKIGASEPEASEDETLPEELAAEAPEQAEHSLPEGGNEDVGI